MDRAGWFNAEFDGAHDYDLARRIGESGGAIAHVPQVLVHQREVRTTLARSSDRRVVGAPLASIVICSRNARLLAKCLRQIEANTAYAARELVIVQHRTGSDRAMERLLARVDCTRLYHDGAFDFSGMNNRAARAARGEILVFLNDDCEPLEDRWLGELIAHAQRSNVGAVGARLLYPTGAVQHAGVAIGIMDGAGHPHRGTFDDNFWPWSLHTRNVSAVTGACLAMRREIFQELGGFDPCFPNNYNDIDLCLRARRQGYQVIYEPAALLRHQESKTRTRGVAWTERALWQERWGEALAASDPYYSRHLTRTREDCSLADG